MDPFSALTVVTSVIIFIDFGGKLLVTGHDIHHAVDGASTENVHIEQLTADLKSLSDKL